MSDPFDLARFEAAQMPVMAQVLEGLQRGRKQTHWMWFVFPQIAGLGHSAMAQRYAISGLDEAGAYLAHLVLGPRLQECTQTALDVEGRSAHDIFGSPDDLKFHSCMTLFARAAPEEPLFAQALERFFSGRDDPLTALAAVILFDQFPRNMVRGHADAYSTDHIALAIAKTALDKDFDAELAKDERKFLYMPFQHSENLEDQNRAVLLFTGIGDDEQIRYAKHHRDVIQRFGRFPHRNAILGRAPCPGEAAEGMPG